MRWTAKSAPPSHQHSNVNRKQKKTNKQASKAKQTSRNQHVRQSHRKRNTVERHISSVLNSLHQHHHHHGEETSPRAPLVQPAAEMEESSMLESTWVERRIVGFFVRR